MACANLGRYTYLMGRHDLSHRGNALRLACQLSLPRVHYHSPPVFQTGAVIPRQLESSSLDVRHNFNAGVVRTLCSCSVGFVWAHVKRHLTSSVFGKRYLCALCA